MGTWLIDRTVSGAGYMAARSFFSSALERQVDHPDALLGLAVCDFGEIFLGLSPSSAFSGIQERLLRGRDLYPRHAGLRAFDGFIRCVCGWEWKAAGELLERAWREKRGDPGVANWYANYLSSAERFEEALNVAEEALALAPASRITAFSVALRLHYLDQNREALAVCDKLIARQPDYWLAYETRGLCQLSLGFPDLAAESFQEAVPDGGGQARIFRSCALALLGLGPDARKELELAERGWGKGHASQFFRALALSYLGETAKAAAAMDKAVEERDFHLAFLHGLPIGKILPEQGRSLKASLGLR
jgi:tetratricopeptide (TPR) repeat protein